MVVETEVKHDQISSIKLIKGQKNNYGWEIKVYNNDLDAAIRIIENVNSALKIKYEPKT